MNISKKIYSPLFIVFLISCGGQKKLSIEDIKPGRVRLRTWNEDTTKPYILLLYDTNSFLYEIVKQTKNSAVIKEIYYGFYTFNNDTVFLKFKSKTQPGNAQPFLVRETTRNYLIQQFKDSTPRVFFRLPNMPRHPYTIFY